MIKAEAIFQKTNGGLDIILDLFPQAKVALEGKNISQSETREHLLRHFVSITHRHMAKFGR